MMLCRLALCRPAAATLQRGLVAKQRLDTKLRTVSILRPSLIIPQRFLSSGVTIEQMKDAAEKLGYSSPDAPHFQNKAHATLEKEAVEKTRKGDIDLSHLITQPVYDKEDLDVHETHREVTTAGDFVASGAIQVVRFWFDLASSYLWKTRLNTMTENDYIRRIIFLETVAGVPGMVAGMVRHMHSLRLMRRDQGWIHSLLAEAENERMHLMIALQLKNPGIIFRGFVLLAQAIAIPAYTICYLLVPSSCHRFIGYLEEEAVRTYTHILEELDAGNLPLLEKIPAPPVAKTYYKLPQDAMIREVLECIRADEAHHRDANHHLGDLDAAAPNTQKEPLRGQLEPEEGQKTQPRETST